MNIIDTLNEIEAFLKYELKELKFPTKNNQENTPQIFQGYLPPKINVRNREDELNYYPFVIVRFLSNEDSLNEGDDISHFRLAIGTYNEDEHLGWKDTVTLMQFIKRRLKEVQIIGATTITGEINMALYEEQSKPLYHGVMEFTLKNPKISWERSVLDGY